MQNSAHYMMKANEQHAPTAATPCEGNKIPLRLDRSTLVATDGKGLVQIVIIPD